MKTKTKKIMAMICLALILLTSLPIQTFAAFITDINSNAQFGVIDGSLANYGHELHYANYDGQTYLVFCTQWGVKSPNGSEYTYNGDFIVQYKNNLPQYERIAEMIYFGYTMNYGTGIPSSPEAIRAMCCTQQYVWETLGVNPSRDSWNGNYMSSGHYANWLAQTEAYYNKYHGNVSFNGITSKVALGQNTAVTDTSGRLASYKTFTQNVNGITFHHDQGSNELNITVPSDCTSDSATFNSREYGLYQLMPNGANYDSNTMSNYIYIQFSSGTVQNLMFSNYVDPSAFSISVEVEYGNTLLIKTNTNGDTLAGCTFGLYKDKNCTQQVRTGTSDSNGQIHFQRLAPATYYIKELSVPAGYLLDTTAKEVTVKANETAEVNFKNDEPTGELKLIKTDKETGNKNRVDGTSHHGDATIEGTEYTLYAKNDIWNVAKTVKYFAKDEKIATFIFNANGIAKINISTGSKTANLITDGNVLKNIPLGSYYAKETKVPEGYLTDNQTHNITLQYKDMHTKVIKAEDTFTNEVEQAKFEVIKVSSITNDTAPILPQAEFTAILTKYVNYYGSFDEALKHLNEFSKDEYSVFKTENTGHGISGLLAYGEYTVQETYCPSIWVNPVKPFKVVIDKNSPDVIKELVENDTPFESYIKMVKQDKKTGKTVTFSNTTFSLYKLNNENKQWEKVSCKLGRESFDTWTTDENGVAYTETKLEAGTYKINEVKIPDGFLQLDEEIVFDVNRANKTCEYDKDWDAYITVTVGNEQPTGTLIVDKSVAIREDVDTSLVDISDLSGIEFTLRAKENIIDYADGSIIYEKGKVVKVFNLDKDGNYTLPELPMGIYELQETKTLDGLVLNNKKYEVKFEQKGLTTKVYEEKKDITNDTTVFEFSKKSVTGDDELEGAKLTVIDKDGKVIDSWVSGKNTHKIEGLKVGETYTLKEEIAPDGYVRSSDIQFKVENTKEVQKVTMIDKIVTMTKSDIAGNEIEGAELKVTDKDGNIIDEWTSTKESHNIKGLTEGQTYTLHEDYAPDGFVISNDIEFTVTEEKEVQKVEMIDKNVEISKQDIAGNELEGATLVVTNTKTKNIVDKWVSTNEPHKVNGLIEGETYNLHEEIVIDGYVKATDIQFTVSEDKETQKVVMVDKIVEIIKTDLVTGEELEGAELEVIDKETGETIDKWTSTKEPHRVVGLEENKTYILKETTCPYGYEQAEEIEFTVSEDKETQRVEMKDMPILKDIRLTKIDSKTNEVIKDKFVFGIYKDAECKELIQEVESDQETGTALFNDLRYGIYYIKEITAPNGYVKSDKVVKVEINDNGVFVDGKQLEENENVYNFEFENAPIETPNTGDASHLKLIGGIMLLSILGITVLALRLYKKNKENK